MANPFPGMDPYLEGHAWSTVHSNLIEEIGRQIVPQVRPKYLVVTARRFVLAPPDEIEVQVSRNRWPDVGVVPTENPRFGGGTATIAAPLLMTALTTEPEPIPLKSIEVRDVTQRRLVTAIELLSPTNERGVGAAEYVTKRRNVLASESHLLEIDLLRLGNRFPVQGRLPAADYFVFLSRSNQRPSVEIWPVSLEQRLPTVPIPLLQEDGDASLDLQKALDTVHDFYSYDQLVDYSADLAVPLDEVKTAWVEERLRQAGWTG